ncbi:hypothetical protein [Lachnoclostridium sp. Marseille-P6806]|uniref:hypothetical protein n=1 Tax=Lachnoclostridium sp. Marseille-P6806 TaxID=2364793 RepID=UPI00103188AF|nr:hypothetical protein [Lachnoclostridium sp. Marseille-P6806]
MRLVNLRPLGDGFLMLWAVLLGFSGFYMILCCIQQKRRALRVAAAVLPLLLSCFLGELLILLSRARQGVPQYRPLAAAIGTLPVSGALAAFLFLSLYQAVSLWETVRWQQRHIDPASVKEAVDILPTGLCYYWAGGRTKMVNGRMEEICRSLTGKTLADGELFWDVVRSRSVRDGGRLLLPLPDGRVFLFARAERALEGRRIYELIASDVTREQELQQKRREQNEELEKIRKRLRRFSEDIGRLTIEKETLRAKIEIHDNLGNILLATRRYLLQEAEYGEDAELIRKLWVSEFRLLRSDDGGEQESGYRSIFRAAEDIGVSIRCVGELPEEPVWMRIMRVAMGECITNTFRHAAGDRLNIHVRREEKRYLVTFMNGGAPPEQEIREGGGLGNLRAAVEAAGGAMQVESQPRFVLRLFLPRDG